MSREEQARARGQEDAEEVRKMYMCLYIVSAVESYKGNKGCKRFQKRLAEDWCKRAQIWFKKSH